MGKRFEYEVTKAVQPALRGHFNELTFVPADPAYSDSGPYWTDNNSPSPLGTDTGFVFVFTDGDYPTVSATYNGVQLSQYGGVSLNPLRATFRLPVGDHPPNLKGPAVFEVREV